MTSVFILFAGCLTTMPRSYAADREPFYRHQKTFTLGSIVIENADIYAIGLVSQSRVTDFDEVDSLKLNEGAKVSVYRDGTRSGAPLLTAIVGKGTGDDPAFFLKGRLSWDGPVLKTAQITALRMRLSKIQYAVPVLGAPLDLKSTEVAFLNIESPMMIEGDHTSAEIRLSGLSGNIARSVIRWADIAIPVNLAATNIAVHFSSSSGSVTLLSGTFADPHVIEVVDPPSIVKLVPHHLIKAANVSVKGVQIESSGGDINVTSGGISVVPSSVTNTDLPSILVAAVLRIDLSDLKQSRCNVREELLECNLPSEATAKILPNRHEVATIVNSYGLVYPQDYLLPTGLPDTQYITLSAFSAIATGRLSEQHRIWLGGGRQEDPECPPVTIDGSVARQIKVEEIQNYRDNLLKLDPKIFQLVTAFYVPDVITGSGINTVDKLASAVASLAFDVILHPEPMLGSSYNPTLVKDLIVLARLQSTTAQNKLLATYKAARNIVVVQSAPAGKAGISRADRDLKHLVDTYNDSALPATIQFSRAQSTPDVWTEQESARAQQAAATEARQTAEAEMSRKQENAKVRQDQEDAAASARRDGGHSDDPSQTTSTPRTTKCPANTNSSVGPGGITTCIPKLQ